MATRLPERPESIPTTKMHVNLHMMWGPIATLVVLTGIELLQLVNVEIPNPAPLYFIPLVFSTLSGGVFAGLLSAAITLIYSAIFYSDPGTILSYSDENSRRFMVIAVATPSVVLMIDLWRRSHERRSGARIGNLQGQLAERGRTEVALGHLAAIVEHAEDAIYSKDLAGRVLTWNPAAERLYGWSAKEMSGQSVLKIIPPDRSQDMTDILNKIMAGGKVEHQISDRVRKDGNRVRIALTVSPIRGAHGGIIGASSIARRI
ncbi:MAG TPA: PAS domain S-box protein [Candidatus Thermoplasmatota archaeon]